MPTLINNIHDRQNIAKWKREYSLISDAFLQTLDEGESVCASYPWWGVCNSSIQNTFRESMMSKLNIVDICGNSNLMPNARCDVGTNGQLVLVKYPWAGIAGSDVRSFYKPLGGSDYIYNYNFGQCAYLLNDGAVVYFGGSHGGPWIVVDVNNFTKGPNELGRDVFVIKVISNISTNEHTLKALGADGTYDKSVNGNVCECSKDAGLNSSAIYLAGQGGSGEVVAGGCCSAYYLYNK